MNFFSIDRRFFQKTLFGAICFGVLSCCFGTPTVSAQGWIKKMFEKKVEADPNTEYTLSETNGPWLIYATRFSGPQARQNANALALELRRDANCKAYVYSKAFNFDLNSEKKQNRNPYAPSFNYKKKGTVEEYAVLIGDFASLEDKDLQNTLKAIKVAHPMTMYRLQGVLNPPNVPQGTPGPLRMAFGVTNPLLPPEFFKQEGAIDEFVLGLNTKRPYSLLNCPRRYTVQVATFTGKVEINPEKVQEILDGKKPFTQRKVSELDYGMKAAQELCRILREKHKIEAYEFHDRYSSIVTVGSFDTYGQQLPNGMIELQPEIVQIMNRFQGKPARQNTGPNTISHEPVRFEGFECDVQPRLIEVPRRSTR